MEAICAGFTVLAIKNLWVCLLLSSRLKAYIELKTVCAGQPVLNKFCKFVYFAVVSLGPMAAQRDVKNFNEAKYFSAVSHGVVAFGGERLHIRRPT